MAQAPVELTVTFGPTPSPLLRRAVAVAQDATTWAEITAGVGLAVGAWVSIRRSAMEARYPSARVRSVPRAFGSRRGM
jgi:hypothetical protein